MSDFNNDDWDKYLGLHQISQEEKDKEQEKKEVWDKSLYPEPEDSSAEASKQKTSGIAKTMAGIAAGAVTWQYLQQQKMIS